MGGRIVAVLFRLDELEQLLDEQLSSSSSLLDSEEKDYRSLGGILSPSSAEENNDSMLVLKQLILENESFRKARARFLLALFLHTVEGQYRPLWKHCNYEHKIKPHHRCD